MRGKHIVPTLQILWHIASQPQFRFSKQTNAKLSLQNPLLTFITMMRLIQSLCMLVLGVMQVDAFIPGASRPTFAASTRLYMAEDVKKGTVKWCVLERSWEKLCVEFWTGTISLCYPEQSCREHEARSCIFIDLVFLIFFKNLLLLIVSFRKK